MSFIEPLDEEGQKIYRDYLIHQVKWVKYIRDRASKSLNDYLESTGKLYDQFGYLTEYLNEYLNDNCTIDIDIDKDTINKDTINKEITDKYKRLCVLFHPDKFSNSSSTEFFTLITKFYKDGNKIIIKAIETVANKILEIPDNENLLSEICKNLTISENKIENQLKHISSSWTSDSIWNILSGNTDNLGYKDNLGDKDNIDYSDFLSSSAYTFYKGDKSTKDYIDSKFITESEFIEKIKNTSEYDTKFVIYCSRKYANNKNILHASKEWLQKQNNLLRQKNANLRSEIDKIESLKKSCI
jgi:hypothetical protein